MTSSAPDPRDTEIGTTSPERVAASQLQDDARWTLSYRDHTASALHRRTLAAQNGHPPTTPSTTSSR